MIAPDFHCCRQTIEYGQAIVVKQRRFAVHQSLGTHDLTAEMRDQALVPEAYAEDGRALGESGDHVQ